MIAPKLSFIVLSYNYRDYIRTTLTSILEQTVQDFEVVVVDDCSTDDSRDVIRSFGDPRIRLLVNERNLGGAGSYNVAVQAARGEWLVNLDADDWIAPEKSALQLAAAAKDPMLDIIGSWVQLVDATGAPHPQAATTEALINRDHQLNRVSTWIGQNPLCRSSTMVRREAHLRIGLDDVSMVRAPDYELWTRALAAGCRFHLLHEPLTYYRLQARGVTHADPVGTLLELAYATVRNLAPLAERRALFEEWLNMIAWFAKHGSMISLTPRQSVRLMAQLLTLPPQTDFRAFRDSLSATEESPLLDRLGRFGLLQGQGHLPAGLFDKLVSDIGAFIDARDYWRKEAEAWEAECRQLGADGGRHLLEEDRDRWRADAERWEAAYRAGIRHRIKASIKWRMAQPIRVLRRALFRSPE